MFSPRRGSCGFASKRFGLSDEIAHHGFNQRKVTKQRLAQVPSSDALAILVDRSKANAVWCFFNFERAASLVVEAAYVSVHTAYDVTAPLDVRALLAPLVCSMAVE